MVSFIQKTNILFGLPVSSQYNWFEYIFHVWTKIICLIKILFDDNWWNIFIVLKLF